MVYNNAIIIIIHRFHEMAHSTSCNLTINVTNADYFVRISIKVSFSVVVKCSCGTDQKVKSCIVIGGFQ